MRNHAKQEGENPMSTGLFEAYGQVSETPDMHGMQEAGGSNPPQLHSQNSATAGFQSCLTSLQQWVDGGQISWGADPGPRQLGMKRKRLAHARTQQAGRHERGHLGVPDDRNRPTEWIGALLTDL